MSLNRSGFSLVEVLVAMVIVTLITTTGMFSFKLAMDQVDRQSTLTFDEPMRFSQLMNLFNATYFYVLEKRDEFFPERFEYNYLFERGDKEITFVSDAPIYSNKLSLVNLKIEDERLIYKETPVYDSKQNYKEPVFAEEVDEYTVLNSIKNAKFTYEEAIDLPKDLKSKIPKLVILEFEKNDIPYKYIFDIKYNYYNLKKFLMFKREML